MEREELIELFKSDTDLLSKYHILAPNSAEVCSQRTIEDLNGSEIFKFEKDGKLIGYFGIKGSCLTGFFVSPENRNFKTLSEFWKEIESKFTKDYYCGLYIKNTRAIEFIRKKAIQEFPIESHDGIFFKIKR